MESVIKSRNRILRVRKGTDMDKKILRKLSREDLLTMLIEQSKELETLKTRAQELEQQLADRSELTAQRSESRRRQKRLTRRWKHCRNKSDGAGEWQKRRRN